MELTNEFDLIPSAPVLVAELLYFTSYMVKVYALIGEVLGILKGSIARYLRGTNNISLEKCGTEN